MPQAWGSYPWISALVLAMGWVVMGSLSPDLQILYATQGEGVPVPPAPLSEPQSGPHPDQHTPGGRHHSAHAPPISIHRSPGPASLRGGHEQLGTSARQARDGAFLSAFQPVRERERGGGYILPPTQHPAKEANGFGVPPDTLT
ncbi:hypothetical protein DPEC_G00087210 [Dallia pectoralis]|uniref:Uncharacterized protein n=1 Tax=Dallia pectoralis TaxID=75939 RepID=A0ACC2H0T7_DALPE|nr:hypothetical protein DPEC_G00087210 [Dallia pectoralis]